jgi:NAD(P)-dependent dehydrogenase (short-subunit alcohol dehydrogenase family)
MTEELVDVRDRAVLITGAGRGIGRSLAEALADRGARVCLAARTESQLEEVAAGIREAGGDAAIAAGDVTNASDAERMVNTTVEAFGRIDGLVNNAGIIRSGQIADMAVEDWDAIMTTNLRGLLLCTQAAIKHMAAQGSGKMVNVASSFGFAPVRGYAAYCASKAAIVHFTRVAALEFARSGVQVNAIAPGYVETDLNADALSDETLRAKIEKRVPAGRIASPDELVPLVGFLLSSASDYITGEAVRIDGGFSIK